MNLGLDLIRKEVEKLTAAHGFDSQTKDASKSSPVRVLIQLPAGLRVHFKEIADAIRRAGGEPVIWAGSCYGACDLPDYKSADLLIHLGHDKFKR